MTKINLRSAAFAIFALGAALAASPASAQAGRVGSTRAQTAHDDERAAVPPNVIGPYTCAYNERHTHLERQNCGGQHYAYGY